MWYILILTSFLLLHAHDGCRINQKYKQCNEVNVIKIIDFNVVLVENVENPGNAFHIRLADISNAEYKSRSDSKRHLLQLLKRYGVKRISISIEGMDKDGVTIARLFGGRTNLNKKMILDGFACPDRPSRKYCLSNNYSRSSLSDNAGKNSKTGRFDLQRIVDGDTVLLVDLSSKSSVKVRMQYIDAPESKQSFGVESQNHLSDIFQQFKQHAIVLESGGKDIYGRTLGVIKLNNIDINKKMVEDGYAWCYKHTRCPISYQNAMKAAKDKKRGLFIESHPQTPWDWRKSKKTNTLF